MSQHFCMEDEPTLCHEPATKSVQMFIDTEGALKPGFWITHWLCDEHYAAYVRANYPNVRF